MQPVNQIESSTNFLGRPDPASEFTTEINQVMEYMNNSNRSDLVIFCFKKFKTMKKYTTSRRNFKFLDDLCKFCFDFLSFEGG